MPRIDSEDEISSDDETPVRPTTKPNSKTVSAAEEDDGESIGSQDSELSEDESVHTSDEEMIADSDEEEPEVESDEDEELLGSDDDESSEEDEEDWVGDDESSDEADDSTDEEDPKIGADQTVVKVSAAKPIVLRKEPPVNTRYSLRRQVKPVERYRDEAFEELMNASDSEEERREGHLWGAKPKTRPTKTNNSKRRKL
jgi:hypothetical protein